MNATPLGDVVKKQHGFSHKYAMIAGMIIATVALGIVGFMLTQQVTTPQTTETQAALPSCLGDSLPLFADPRCYTGNPPTSPTDNNWKPCPAPQEGYCKKKSSACVECRSGVLRTICKCQITPTFPPRPTLTPPPNCPRPAAVTKVVINCPNCPSQ